MECVGLQSTGWKQLQYYWLLKGREKTMQRGIMGQQLWIQKKVRPAALQRCRDATDEFVKSCSFVGSGFAVYLQVGLSARPMGVWHSWAEFWPLQSSQLQARWESLTCPDIRWCSLTVPGKAVASCWAPGEWSALSCGSFLAPVQGCSSCCPVHSCRNVKHSCLPKAW